MLQFWTHLLLLTFGKKKSRDDFKKVGNHWLLIHKSLWKVHGKQISKWNLLRRISAKKERFVGTSNSLFLFAIFFLSALCGMPNLKFPDQGSNLCTCSGNTES